MSASRLTTPGDPPIEPVLDGADIQGNVVPGFLKPLSYVVALRIGDVAGARSWLGRVAPVVTTADGVMPSRRLVRAERLARRVRADATVAAQRLDDVWLNLSVSYGGLKRLFEGIPQRLAELDGFADEGFRAGMAARSALLGDPTDPTAPGYPGNWKVGAPGNEPDVLLVFGADEQPTMRAFVATVCKGAIEHGLSVLYEEQGLRLPDGAEHFGFRDGVSQPGVRGRFNDDTGEFITPRTIAPSQLPEAWLYGLPGQSLIWPGEFVFGYPGQGADPLLPGPPRSGGPAWTKNGSLLVFRRLRQDVAAFSNFVATTASELETRPGFEGVTASDIAARLIGRWPSGAPLSRVPNGDDATLGADPLANNHFGFGADTRPLHLAQGGTTDGHREATTDPIGLQCPLVAHIRKVNPRDAGNDQGGRRASFDRRLLRRGLPYGPPYEQDPAAERGLLFISIQSSTTQQFEFLSATWMNDPTNPRSPSGHDMVVGQNGQPGAKRERSCVLLGSGGHAANVATDATFVTPTGGGYFFVPSVSAIRDILAGDSAASPTDE